MREQRVAHLSNLADRNPRLCDQPAVGVRSDILDLNAMLDELVLDDRRDLLDLLGGRQGRFSRLSPLFILKEIDQFSFYYF